MAFSPPAADEIEKSDFKPPSPDEFDLSEVKPNPLQQSQLANVDASGYGTYGAPGPNPDMAAVLPILKMPGALLGAGLEAIGEGAVKLADLPTRYSNWGKTPDSPGYVPTLEERTSGGRSIINFPRVEGKGPFWGSIAGAANLVSDTATSMLGRPQSALTLPLLAGEGTLSKIGAGAFGTEAALGVPDAVANAWKTINDPKAKASEKTEAALSPLLQGWLAKTMLTHAGAPNARAIPGPEGLPQPQVRTRVGEEAPLRQQGQAAEAQAAVAQAPQIPLSDENAKLLAQHWDDDTHEFATLGQGNVMRASHATGKVRVDPHEFARWVENDLAGLTPEEKSKEIKAAFDHEDIHLKTSPDDALKFAQSLSPVERAIFTRNYMKGNQGTLTPRQLGFEVIRKRVQQASGMTPSEFVGLVGREEWTAKSLDALAETIGSIRSAFSKDLSAAQKGILDKVSKNIAAARSAVPAEPAPQQEAPPPAPVVPPESKVSPPENVRVPEPERQTAASKEQQEYDEKTAYLKELIKTSSGKGPIEREMAQKARDLLKAHLEENEPFMKRKAEGDEELDSHIMKVSGMSGDEFVDATKSWKGGLTGEAYRVGQSIKSKEQLDQLGRLSAEASQRGREAGRAGDFKTGFTEVQKGQFFREAYEAATGTGSAGLSLRKSDPNYKPPVPMEEGPAMKRKYDPDQDKFFQDITVRGKPGEEPEKVRATAGEAGATILPTKQTVFPEEVDFTGKYSELPYRPITESEAKSPEEMAKFLTKDARQEGSKDPVSFTRRLTALFDRRDGSVHLVSTYRGDGTARMVDPRIAGKERPNRPVEEMLDRYRPIYSILLREPKQNYHMRFHSMEEFQRMFSDTARQKMREAGTGTTGIPTSPVRATPVRGAEEGGGLAQEPVSSFVFPREEERQRPRPLEPELKAFYDFFGDELPSDRGQFEKKLVSGAAGASRQMIAGLRKMAKLEMSMNRGMSMGQALDRVFDKLYENATSSGTRSEFVERTLAQSRTGLPKEVQAGGAEGARPSKTKRVITLQDLVKRGESKGTGAPLPEQVPSVPTAMLSPEEKQAVEEQVKRGETPPPFPLQYKGKPTILGRQLLARDVPKEPYSMGRSKTIAPVEGEGEEQPMGSEAMEDIEAGEARSRRKGTQSELFPERQLMSQKPDVQVKPEGEELLTKTARPKVEPRTKEEVTGMQKALDKAASSKRQLDLFNKEEGPAMKRKADDAYDKLVAYIRRTHENISTAGSLSDQLFRLKTNEQADYDQVIPVIKAALKIIPPSDRQALMHFADETQVLGKSDVKLTDSQRLLYDTFIDPLIKENTRMFEYLKRSGIPMEEDTYMSRVVQDTHSLFSRMARGAKKRAIEGSILGRSASFFKRRVFKAIEDEDGNRKLVALVGSGDRIKVLEYKDNKASLMGDMGKGSFKSTPLTDSQKNAQRIADMQRNMEVNRLNKQADALDAQLNNVRQRPAGEGKQEAMDAIQDKIDALQGERVRLEERFPIALFDTPKVWVDKGNKRWKLTDATIREIESNTQTRYYKEPMAGILTQNLKLKQIYRANEFLENLKNSSDFKRVSMPAGGSGGRDAPPDWKTIDVPEFKGLRIEPRTAEVLELFHQERKGPADALKFAYAMTSFLKNSLFIWNPFVHEPNLLNHWFTARGAEWARPSGYARGIPSMVQAFNDVLTRSQFRDQALRAGAPLLDQTRNMSKAVLSLLSKEMDTSPGVGQKVAKALGYINPFRAVRAFGDSLTWGTNEVLWLSLIRETMQRTGLPLEDAISEIGKHMPTYRVPPRVLGSKLISHVMRNPLLTLWGHYHYSAFKSYGEMGKEIFNPASSVGQRVEGLGRVATIGFLLAAAYPIVDDIIQKITGNKNFHIRRAGSATLPANILDVARQRKTPEAALQSVMTPSPLPTAALEFAFNRNLRTGFPVYDRRLGKGTAGDIGNFAAQQVSPVQEATKVFGGQKSYGEFGLGLAGVSQSRVDTAMSKFGRLADDWMKNSPDKKIQEQYKTRASEVFPETDYRNLRSAIVRGDDRASELFMKKLLDTRHPSEIQKRIEIWKHSPFTGTKETERDLMKEMTPQEWDLWYQAKQERYDIANKMKMQLLDSLAK